MPEDGELVKLENVEKLSVAKMRSFTPDLLGAIPPTLLSLDLGSHPMNVDLLNAPLLQSLTIRGCSLSPSEFSVLCKEYSFVVWSKIFLIFFLSCSSKDVESEST